MVTHPSWQIPLPHTTWAAKRLYLEWAEIYHFATPTFSGTILWCQTILSFLSTRTQPTSEYSSYIQRSSKFHPLCGLVWRLAHTEGFVTSPLLWKLHRKDLKPFLNEQICALVWVFTPKLTGHHQWKRQLGVNMWEPQPPLHPPPQEQPSCS